MGPALLPRWLAYAVGLCGLALIILAFRKDGDALERWSLRGPVFVIGGILAFAITIRPFAFGSLTTPGLGLLFAGPLAILIGGFAASTVLLMSVPFLNLFFRPILVAASTHLLGHIEPEEAMGEAVAPPDAVATPPGDAAIESDPLAALARE